MKRKLTVLLLALCLAFTLGGCRKEAGQTGLPSESQEPSSDVVSGKFDMPDIRFFDASLLDSSAVTAEELYGGKDVTVINCWTTWCPPCLEEMDSLAAFEKTLPDNVQLVSFCVDGLQHTEECVQILEDAGFEGIVLIDANGDFRTLLEEMQYVPTTLFVDSMGSQLSDCLIGAPEDLAKTYTEYINAGLKAQGKDPL